MNVFIGIDVTSEVDHFTAGNGYAVLNYGTGVEIQYTQAKEFVEQQLNQITFSDASIQTNFEQWRKMALEVFERQLPSMEDECISTFEDEGVQVDLMYRPEEVVLGYFDDLPQLNYSIALTGADDEVFFKEDIGDFDALIDNLDQHVKATVDEFFFRIGMLQYEGFYEFVLKSVQDAILTTQGNFDNIAIPIEHAKHTYTLQISAVTADNVKH